MADNYTNFSQSIEDVTDEERKWILEEMIDGEDRFGWAEDREAEGEIAIDDFCEKYGLEDIEDINYWPGFNCTVRGTTVYLYSEESGNPDNVAALMQQFLAKFRPDEAFCMEVVYTCSKPRPDAFGSSCLFVTKDSIEWSSTATWAAKKWQAFREKSVVHEEVLITLMNELGNQSEWVFGGREVVMARMRGEKLEVELSPVVGEFAGARMILELTCTTKVLT